MATRFLVNLRDSTRPLRMRVSNSRLVAALWTLTTRLRFGIRPPQRFDEKVRYKMAFDRRPMLPVYADKIAVRKYVSEVIGSAYLPELYDVFRTGLPEDLNIPECCVVKPSHGSGAVVLIAPEPPAETKAPDVGTIQMSSGSWFRWQGWMSSMELDINALNALCTNWLGSTYSLRQWAYRNIEPGIMVEELLMVDGRPPDDLKFYVINGEVVLVQSHVDRFGAYRKLVMSPSWEVLGVDGVTPENPQGVVGLPEPPSRLDQMCEVAAALAGPMDFVRVDLYDVDGEVKFSELTHYPNGGRQRFQPPEVDQEFLWKWQPPHRYVQS